MNDFDFFTGTWDVANRRRVDDFLDPASEWEEFPAVSQAARHFDGRAHFDEISFPTKGYAGLTLRLLDPETGQWSLYWVSKRTCAMEPPVTGQFKDGIGDFFGEDTYNDVAILVRYRWSDITADSARWEQAFSTDGGQSWLDNWYMQMTRRS
ncbi:MAG TPA: hypothetical protein VMU95_31965 [Trebonia sp.]|nr:hypothetical protein [Trebonia sp.]